MSLKESSDRPTKLKRKDTKMEGLKAISSNTSDMYQKVNEYEELMAAKRDSDDDEILKLCNEFDDIINVVADLKLEGKYEEIAERQTGASLLFVMLKKLNRLDKLRLNNAREKLNEAKRQVDSSHLQLQNLLYEACYLKKEISKCLQFVSRDELIQLVPTEEFYKKAPPSISRPEVSREDEHQLKLARLEWELEQRKILADKCRILEEQKQFTTSAIREKQVRIEDLGPMVKKILKVTKPVQEHLNLSASELQAEPELAHLLPHTLYFLCMQVDALRQACDPLLKVQVIGCKEECEQFKPTPVDTVTVEEDSDSDGSENYARRRSKSQGQLIEEKINNLFVRHPLSVVITVSLKDGKNISILFVYYVNLDIVAIVPTVNIPKPYTGLCCIQLLDPFTVLNALFPDDYGELSPNVANHYQFQQLGVQFNKCDYGSAYLWAQHLCGLTYVTSYSSDTRCSSISIDAKKNTNTQECTISIIKAIRKRLESRLDLCYQMNHIESAVLPINLLTTKPFIPPKVNSKLVKWEMLTWESYKELRYTFAMVDEGVVSDRDHFFTATFMNGSAFLFATICLKSDYPTSSPIYSVQLKHSGITRDSENDNNIRDIERELNVYYEEYVNNLKKPVHLLLVQLLQISVSLDIYLECTNPIDYPKEKLFLKSFRTRIRNLPLKYSYYVREGIFVQR